MAAAKITLYHYPNCSTCRNARKWLDAEGVEYRAIDLVETPPSASRLRQLWKCSGLDLKRFFNTSGQSYRGGGFKEKLPSMSDGDKIKALAADGKLIKRPIVDTGEAVLVGFRADAYADTLK